MQCWCLGSASEAITATRVVRFFLSFGTGIRCVRVLVLDMPEEETACEKQRTLPSMRALCAGPMEALWCRKLHKRAVTLGEGGGSYRTWHACFGVDLDHASVWCAW